MDGLSLLLVTTDTDRMRLIASADRYNSELIVNYDNKQHTSGPKVTADGEGPGGRPELQGK